jgi:cytosine deaminase
MEFALQCAYAHGTRAIRTHLDTIGAHGRAVWPLFREIQRDWAGRIALQAAALTMPDTYLGEDGPGIGRMVAETEGGVLGAVLMHDNATEDRLDAVFATAERFGCALDLHVDENGVEGATALEMIAAQILRRRFRYSVLCGHCCSLSVQQEARAAEIVQRVADAGIGIVSLPMCNLYLQDRVGGRTPRWRGITLVHELRAAGVRVMFASDNTRDPFYAYGDLDMVEVFAQAVRIGHLDHPFDGWVDAVTTVPGAWMGGGQTIATGQSADFLILAGRSLNQIVSRPGCARVVVRGGRQVTAQAPDYDALHA